MMKFSVCLALCLVLFCVAIKAEEHVYVQTPHGRINSKCVHDIDSGSTVRVLEERMEISGKKQTYSIPLCDRETMKPQELPGSYDGWTSYAAFEGDETYGFDTMTNYFSVPDIPAKTPQILYLFPGLQNVDWIPVVDPDVAGFDIIQPVLQFPGDRGDYWSIKSWYVTVDGGYLASKEIKVSPGDKVFGNMTMLGTDEWYIGTTSASGETTEVTVTRERLNIQPWSYITLECYGCSGCETYPTEPAVFSQIELTTQGKMVTPTWNINPKPSQLMKCNETTIASADGKTVTISFQY